MRQSTADEGPTFAYTAGGTLAPDAPSYVERQADLDLLSHLRERETCYVLNSRQMGKSSLCVRTILRLKQAGIRTAFLDLTKFGGRNLTAEQWYAALLSEIGRELGLRSEFLGYWKENADLPPVQRLFGALTEVGLKEDSPVVVFIDEIDVTLSLPFSADEFFAAIRQCYVGRATDEKLKRLSFCLLGTATPADLIQDTRVSPFNIGKRIELRDFTAQEAAPLATGLGDGALLERVLHWTGGHPYLTQRLCQAVMDSNSKDVDQVCSDLFLTHSAKEGDDNLAFVRNRLLKSEADLAALLDLYKKMCSGKSVQDDETNPLCALLKLSGVAKVEGGLLKVRNRIYEHVFDQDWVETHMPDAEKRRQKEAYRRGVLRALALSGAALVLVGGLALFGFVSRSQAISEARRASKAESAARRISEDRLQSLYFANMNAIPAHFARNNFDQVQMLLNETADSKYRGFEWGYWNGLAHQELKTFGGRSIPVNSVSFSPDGTKLLMSGSDGIALIFDSKTYQQLGELIGGAPVKNKDESGYFAATWSPDGKSILTCGSHKNATLWDAETLRKRSELKGKATFLVPCAFAENGAVVAVACDDGYVRIWSTETGLELGRLHTQAASLAANQHTGRLLTGNDEKGSAIEWDWKTGKQVSSINIGIQVWCTAYSRDGSKILTGGPDSSVKVWEASTKRLLYTLSYAGGISRAAFSADGKYIIAGGWHNTATIWDVTTQKVVHVLRGHGSYLYDCAISPDSKTAVTASFDGSAKLWDLGGRQGSRLLSDRKAMYDSVQFSADSNRLLIKGFTDYISPSQVNDYGWLAVEYDLRNGRVAREFTPKGKYDPQSFFEIGYSGKDDQLVAMGPQGRVTVGDSEAGRLIAQVNKKAALRSDTLAATHDLVVVATGVPRLEEKVTEAQVLNVQSREHVALRDATAFGMWAAISPNGALVAGGSADANITIWDAKTGRVLKTLSSPHLAYPMTFSGDSQRLAVGYGDGSVVLWDVLKGSPVREFGTISAPIMAVQITPDGKRIVAGSQRGDLIVWDVDTGKQALWIYENTDSIQRIAVSQDGTKIATASIDGTVRMYTSDGKVGVVPR